MIARDMGRKPERRLLASLLVALCGCGAGGQAAVADQDLLPTDDVEQELTLVVKNLNFYDAELYARDQSHRRRLGFVSGNDTANFSFRWPPSRDLQIEIHLVAVGTYLSDPLPVEEGDDLELIIEPDLHRERPARQRPSG